MTEPVNHGTFEKRDPRTGAVKRRVAVNAAMAVQLRYDGWRRVDEPAAQAGKAEGKTTQKAAAGKQDQNAAAGREG